MPNLTDLIGQGQSTGLDNLAQLIQLIGQQGQRPVETAPIAGHNILVKRGNNPFNALTSLATGYSGARTLQKRNQFLQGVQQIAQEQTTPDEKINKLLGLMAEHGSDYGLGLKDIVTQYGQMAGRNKFATAFGVNGEGQYQVPEGMEIAGYDQKGNPMIRKTKSNIAEKKFDISQEEKKQQLETKSQFVKDSALDTLNTIGEVEKGINKFGLTGNWTAIPGTPRATWIANVNKLLSGKIINLMTQMKEASKTGATGFGQLSEKELKVLQEASTALKRNLPPGDAQKILNEMKVSLQKIAQKTEQGNKQLDQQTAMAILKQAGGDKNKAREIARQLGYQF